MRILSKMKKPSSVSGLMLTLILTCFSLGEAYPVAQAKQEQVRATVFKEKSADKTCVAWETRKTLMLFMKKEPVGMHCSVKVRFVKGSESDNYALQIDVPIDGFDSGDSTRDKEVLNILKAGVMPSIQIVTDALPESTWRKRDSLDETTLGATLTGGFGSYPLTLVAHKKATVWRGVVKTSFSQLGLKQPSVAGGMVADVEDILFLHFQVKDLLSLPGLGQ